MRDATPIPEPSEALRPFRPRRYPPPLEVRLKRRTRRVRQLHGLITWELADPTRVPLALRLRALRHGFLSLHWRLYELDRNDPADYVPSFANLDFGVGRPHVLALTDKLTFARVAERLGLRQPRPLGVIEGGRLIDLEDGRSGVAGAALTALAERYGGVVLRPVSGGAGRGVRLLTVADGRLRCNGEEVTAAALNTLLAGDEQVLATELIHQAPYAAAIAPGSCNTVRILTVWDPDTLEPLVAAAAHRFGLARTYPIDNFHGGKGGLTAAIDPASGILGPGATQSPEGEVLRFAAHPESGVAIAGCAVPWWHEAVSETLRAAAALPHVPYVGWDLVITPEGPSFIEANSPPGTMVWQVHGGLLRDPRVRRFYERWGLIERRR